MGEEVLIERHTEARIDIVNALQSHQQPVDDADEECYSDVFLILNHIIFRVNYGCRRSCVMRSIYC